MSVAFNVRSAVGAAVMAALLAPGAHAADYTLSASLFSPTLLINPVVIDSGTTPTGIAPKSGSSGGVSYTISFAGTPVGEGDVAGNAGGLYAIPVAGVLNGMPTYLTGNYGSPQTSDPSVASPYFSTGFGSISVSFSSSLTSLALLWGSIDTGNSLTLGNGDVITGTQVQAAAAGFVGNGFQGAGGSAYVTVNTLTPFTSFTASSSTISFEFAGVVGALTAIAVPEPASLALLGTGLLGLSLIGRRRA